MYWVGPPRVTLGKSGAAANVVAPRNAAELGVQYFPSTAAATSPPRPGPTRRLPILDLDQFFPDIHKYLRFLEEAIRTCANTASSPVASGAHGRMDRPEAVPKNLRIRRQVQPVGHHADSL